MRAHGESQECRDPSARARLGHEDRDRLVGEARHVEVSPLREHCGGCAQAVHETLVVRLGLREAERAGFGIPPIGDERARLVSDRGDEAPIRRDRDVAGEVEMDGILHGAEERERAVRRRAAEDHDGVVIAGGDVDVPPVRAAAPMPRPTSRARLVSVSSRERLRSAAHSDAWSFLSSDGSIRGRRAPLRLSDAARQGSVS